MADTTWKPGTRQEKAQHARTSALNTGNVTQEQHDIWSQLNGNNTYNYNNLNQDAKQQLVNYSTQPAQPIEQQPYIGDILAAGTPVVSEPNLQDIIKTPTIEDINEKILSASKDEEKNVSTLQDLLSSDEDLQRIYNMLPSGEEMAEAALIANPVGFTKGIGKLGSKIVDAYKDWAAPVSNIPKGWKYATASPPSLPLTEGEKILDQLTDPNISKNIWNTANEANLGSEFATGAALAGSLPMLTALSLNQDILKPIGEASEQGINAVIPTNQLAFTDPNKSWEDWEKTKEEAKQWFADKSNDYTGYTKKKYDPNFSLEDNIRSYLAENDPDRLKEFDAKPDKYEQALAELMEDENLKDAAEILKTRDYKDSSLGIGPEERQEKTLGALRNGMRYEDYNPVLAETYSKSPVNWSLTSKYPSALALATDVVLDQLRMSDKEKDLYEAIDPNADISGIYNAQRTAANWYPNQINPETGLKREEHQGQDYLFRLLNQESGSGEELLKDFKKEAKNNPNYARMIGDLRKLRKMDPEELANMNLEGYYTAFRDTADDEYWKRMLEEGWDQYTVDEPGLGKLKRGEDGRILDSEMDRFVKWLNDPSNILDLEALMNDPNNYQGYYNIGKSSFGIQDLLQYLDQYSDSGYNPQQLLPWVTSAMLQRQGGLEGKAKQNEENSNYINDAVLNAVFERLGGSQRFGKGEDYLTDYDKSLVHNFNNLVDPDDWYAQYLNSGVGFNNTSEETNDNAFIASILAMNKLYGTQTEDDITNKYYKKTHPTSKEDEKQGYSGYYNPEGQLVYNSPYSVEEIISPYTKK